MTILTAFIKGHVMWSFLALFVIRNENDIFECYCVYVCMYVSIMPCIWCQKKQFSHWVLYAVLVIN